MAISPWYVGQTWPVWVVDFNLNNNGVPAVINLSGANVTAIIKDKVLGTETPATGTITVVDAVNGVVNYTPSGADVATAGSYTIQFLVNWGNGRELPMPPVGWTIIST